MVLCQSYGQIVFFIRLAAEQRASTALYFTFPGQNNHISFNCNIIGSGGGGKGSISMIPMEKEIV